MNEFLFYTVMVALVAAFGLTLLRKWRVIEWVQVHGNDFFAKMFNCDFCLSFWSGLASIINAVVIPSSIMSRINKPLGNPSLKELTRFRKSNIDCNHDIL